VKSGCRVIPPLLLALCTLIPLAGAAIPPAGAAPSDSIRSQDVIAHLKEVVSWYRDLSSVEPSAGDVLIRDNLHQVSLKALQLAFQFARAEGARIGAEQNPQQPAPSANLQQAAAKAADRVSAVQSKIAEVDSEIQKGAGRRVEILSAQRNELTAELELAKEIQATVQNLVNFRGAIGSGGELAGQIDELERSVPEATGKNSSAAQPTKSSKAAASGPVFSADSAGVIGLATELFSLHSSREELDDRRKRSDLQSGQQPGSGAASSGANSAHRAGERVQAVLDRDRAAQ
jgi:hypothetical protein